jgi:hypothetical protein
MRNPIQSSRVVCGAGLLAVAGLAAGALLQRTFVSTLKALSAARDEALFPSGTNCSAHNASAGDAPVGPTGAL